MQRTPAFALLALLLSSLPAATACGIAIEETDSSGSDTEGTQNQNQNGPSCESLADTASLTGAPSTITIRNDSADTIVIVTGECASDPISLDGEQLTTDWTSWACESVPTCAGLPIPLDCHYAPLVDITVAPGASHDIPWTGVARKPIALPKSCAPCSDAPTVPECQLAYVPEAGDHELALAYLRGPSANAVSYAKVTVTLPASNIVIPITAP